jgi:hypothetical protein
MEERKRRGWIRGPSLSQPRYQKHFDANIFVASPGPNNLAMCSLGLSKGTWTTGAKRVPVKDGLRVLSHNPQSTSQPACFAAVTARP